MERVLRVESGVMELNNVISGKLPLLKIGFKIPETLPVLQVIFDDLLMLTSTQLTTELCCPSEVPLRQRRAARARRRAAPHAARALCKRNKYLIKRTLLDALFARA